MKKRDLIRVFKSERDVAILSLDRGKIVTYCKKWDIPIPENEEVFWRGVHKAIVNLNSASPDRKEASREWLAEHGSSPKIIL